MSKKLPAQLISYIFDPVVIFVLSVVVLAIPLKLSDQVAALIFIMLGGMLPVATSIYEYYNTRINRKITRTERNEVYIGGIIGFGSLVAIFASDMYKSSYWLSISMAVTVYFGLTLIVNYFFDKASQHIGVFSFWVMILIDRGSNGFGLLLALLLLIAWARIDLKAHTWAQIFWGLAVGLLAGIIAWPF